MSWMCWKLLPLADQIFNLAWPKLSLVELFYVMIQICKKSNPKSWTLTMSCINVPDQAKSPPRKINPWAWINQNVARPDYCCPVPHHPDLWKMPGDPSGTLMSTSLTTFLGWRSKEEPWIRPLHPAACVTDEAFLPRGWCHQKTVTGKLCFLTQNTDGASVLRFWLRSIRS